MRLATFAVAAGVAAWIGLGLATGVPAADPIEDAIHRTGDWTLYFLLASLAVTPLKRMLGWSRLATIRRMLGVTAFCYAAAHLILYVFDMVGDLGMVASEIANRFYLTIGFVALVGLALLAVTSFDAAIRRLRRNWKRLRATVYGLTVLGLVHFFLQSRLDVSEPVLLGGLFVGLMLLRALAAHRVPASALAQLSVAVSSGLVAAAIEYGWYATMTGIAAENVLSANLQPAFQPRPMWVVMLFLASPLVVGVVARVAWVRQLADAVALRRRGPPSAGAGQVRCN